MERTDGQVNIETWYSKITFDIVFILMKDKVCLKSKREIYALAKSFIFSFSIYKIFSYLVSFADFPPNLYLLLLRSSILNISIVSFSSNLIRLNALSAYPKLEPTGNAQNLSLGLILQIRAVETNSAPQQYWQKLLL